MSIRSIHCFSAEFTKIDCVHSTVTDLYNVCYVTYAKLFVEYTFADIKKVLYRGIF